MAEMSKTAAAAAKAVKRGQKVDAKDRTFHEILADIRRNLDAHLSVTPNDIRALLAAYDAFVKVANESPDAPAVSA